MSQIDSACTRKTCLSHVYDTSACDQYILSNFIDINSVVLTVAILGLNPAFH